MIPPFIDDVMRQMKGEVSDLHSRKLTNKDKKKTPRSGGLRTSVSEGHIIALKTYESDERDKSEESGHSGQPEIKEEYSLFGFLD